MFEYYGGCEFMVCSVFTLRRGSNIPSVAAISHKPKAGASSPPELWKTTPSPFLSIITENGTSSDIFFGFFLQNRLPVPLYWHSAFLWYRNESCFSFMHQILNGINHWLAFPPIHCVKLGFFDLMISDHHQAKHNSSMYYFIVDDPSFPFQVFRLAVQHLGVGSTDSEHWTVIFSPSWKYFVVCLI